MSAAEFQRWVLDHRDAVYGLALWSLKHREDAEDVTQEVFIRLWDHRRKLDPAGLRPWLLRVTRNACCDLVRRRQRQKLDGDPEPHLEREPSAEPGPLDRAEHADFERRLSSALGEIQEPYRSIVVLREIQELKYEEIAEVVGKPLNTVKVYLHRGRKMLRERLSETAPSPLCQEAAHAS